MAEVDRLVSTLEAVLKEDLTPEVFERLDREEAKHDAAVVDPRMALYHANDQELRKYHTTQLRSSSRLPAKVAQLAVATV